MNALQNIGEFEETHSISTKLEECPKCKEEGNTNPVQRKINSNNGFILQGSGWFKSRWILSKNNCDVKTR